MKAKTPFKISLFILLTLGFVTGCSMSNSSTDNISSTSESGFASTSNVESLTPNSSSNINVSNNSVYIPTYIDSFTDFSSLEAAIKNKHLINNESFYLLRPIKIVEDINIKTFDIFYEVNLDGTLLNTYVHELFCINDESVEVDHSKDGYDGFSFSMKLDCYFYPTGDRVIDLSKMEMTNISEKTLQIKYEDFLLINISALLTTDNIIYAVNYVSQNLFKS